MSVILPVLNEAGTVGTQLTALAGQSPDLLWELLVVDNGSTDGTEHVVAGWADRFQTLAVVDGSARRGLSYAKNCGAGVARGQRLAFCDADDVVGPNWVEAMARELDQDVLVTGPTYLVKPTDPKVPQPGPTPGMRMHNGRVAFAFGCNMGIDAQALQRLGGFDEVIRHAEDIDLSWRAQLAGMRLNLDPDAVVWKSQRPNARSRFRQHRGYGRSDVALARKFGRSGAFARTPRDEARLAAWLLLHLHFLFQGPHHRFLLAGPAGRLSGHLLETCRPFVRPVWASAWPRRHNKILSGLSRSSQDRTTSS